MTIESSCDETAAAVIRDGRTILSSIVASQVAVHADYGGVVPEIASRKHMEAVSVVVEQALAEAGTGLEQIEGVAVTQGPGLVGALLVGICTARSLAWARGVPLVGVNHIESHLLAAFLEQPVEFPFVALVVSGGHTHLYWVEGVGRYRTLGQTVDDAAGEAFDKSAKLLGFRYPGGALIDARAAEGDPRAIRFPRPLIHEESFDFSFSGLKTSVLTYLRQHPEAAVGGALDDLCASFQAAVCDVLTVKTRAALRATGARRLVVAGGVACNSGIRREMALMAASEGVTLHIPSPGLCGDNAAMLGVPGDYYLSHGYVSGGIDALPSWPLDAMASRLQRVA